MSQNVPLSSLPREALAGQPIDINQEDSVSY